MSATVVRKRSGKAGLSPGTMVHIGEKKMESVQITIADYDEKSFQQKETKKIEDCFPFKETPTVTWININGIHDVETISKLGKHFDFHPLILEDIVNTEQRPKIEDFETYLYLVLRSLYEDKKGTISQEQVSLIVGSNFVISFQEGGKDSFGNIRERLKNNKGRLRKMGSDYLAYALMDSIVDNYFAILEKIGERIETVEEMLVTRPTPHSLKELHNLKKEIIFLRRSIWPLRDVINSMQRGESDLIKKTTQIYLRDIYDHTVQIIDSIEAFRDMLSEMLDIYLSSMSNRMNEVMKMLTIIATIFIPLTFIVGIYGMNFTYMPELDIIWAYPAVMAGMLVIGLTMVYYFKKRKWI